MSLRLASLLLVLIVLAGACGGGSHLAVNSPATERAATAGAPRVTPVASVGRATAVAGTATFGGGPTNTPMGQGEATPAPGVRTVTLADDGGTISLYVGEGFLLGLGEEFDWTVTVGNLAIVSRVDSLTLLGGAQGVYQARAVGQTTLTAVGDPLCRRATPACAAPSRSFRVTIVVS